MLRVGDVVQIINYNHSRSYLHRIGTISQVLFTYNDANEVLFRVDVNRRKVPGLARESDLKLLSSSAERYNLRFNPKKKNYFKNQSQQQEQ